MEDSLQLTPSRWKHLALLAGSAGFVGLAFVIGPRESILAWLTGGFFGLGVVVALIAMIPGSSFLRLGSKGISVRSLYRTWHVAWADVAEFYVAPVAGRKMVCWQYSAGFTGHTRGRAFSRAISGVEAGLPDTYGISSEELAWLLNEWRVGNHDARPNNSFKPKLLRSGIGVAG